ncbi:MAG TPA: hypothetical protein VFM91_05005, partial [Propionibacteriaceae bacterium]|nr:hypothetical protein [Propionibacteriaceae bacterium]
MSYPAPAHWGASPIAPGTSEVVPRPHPFGRDTLGRQLVIRVTALVALAALLITTATALATRQVLMSQLDRQLDAVTARVRDPVGSYTDRDPDSGLLRPGQPIGTLVVIYDIDGNPQSGGRLTERGASGQQGAAVTVLPDAAVSQLAGIPTGGTKSSIDLSGLGHYRVVGFRIVAGTATVGALVVGVPLSQVDQTIIELVALAALFSLLVIAGTVFAARSLVVRSLRPLNRLATTAQQVSQLKLDRGEVAL